VEVELPPIPPPAQRAMAERADATTAEIAGSHAISVSRPDGVAELIEQAAAALVAAPRWTARCRRGSGSVAPARRGKERSVAGGANGQAGVGSGPVRS
jgi:hypothetical protein